MEIVKAIVVIIVGLRVVFLRSSIIVVNATIK